MACAAGEAAEEAVLALSRRKCSTRARRPAAKAAVGAPPPDSATNGRIAGGGNCNHLLAARMCTAEVLELETGTLEVLASMQAAATDSRRAAA